MRYPEHERASGALDYIHAPHLLTARAMTHHRTSPTPAHHLGRTSAAWRRCATRRDANPPTLPLRNLAGAQGVLGRFGTWYLRVFPVVVSTCTTVQARPAHVRCLFRLFATPVGGADRCKTRRWTAIDSSHGSASGGALFQACAAGMHRYAKPRETQRLGPHQG